jgi:hypothetical protein
MGVKLGLTLREEHMLRVLESRVLRRSLAVKFASGIAKVTK